MSFFAAALVLANEPLFDLLWGEGHPGSAVLLAPVFLIVGLVLFLAYLVASTLALGGSDG